MRTLFIALFLVGQTIAPTVPTYKGVYVQPPYVCGAQHATRALRIAVIGNSLAWSPPQPNFNWTQSNGMAANTLENDYAHIICVALAERHSQTVALLVLQGWAIERAINEGIAWDRTYSEVLAHFAPDVLVLQISDNVTPSQSIAFGQAYDELLSEMKPRSKVICLGGWYSSIASLSAIIQDKCAMHSGAFVPINDIYESSSMRGSSFDTEVNKGVGSHPNDLGHAEIARRVILEIE